MAITGIRELFERSDASGSRSTILKPLTWFLSITISGIIFLIKYNAPNWILILFAIIICIAIIIFLFAYVYCLFKDRDALRNEKYSIQKLAIEKGIVGDDITGVLPDSQRQKIGGNDVSNQSKEEN